MLRSKESHEEMMRISRERNKKKKEKAKQKNTQILCDKSIIQNYKAEIRQYKKEIKYYKSVIKDLKSQIKYKEYNKPFIGEDIHSITINYRI